MPTPVALSIGTFDGVHRGHQALIAAARNAIPAGRVAVLAFDPHPISILRPEQTPSRLSIFGQRSRWLAELGVDEVIRLEPTPELLSTSAEEFVARIVRRFSPAVIVEGPDFKFGQAREGDAAVLSELGGKHGFDVIVVDPVTACLADRHEIRVSSSMIRWLVAQGRVRDAATLLGRPYEIETTVVKGDQRGRTIGMPTANLAPGGQLLPADGIYAGLAHRPDGSTHAAAISVGTKPTFGSHPRTAEAHLLDYRGPLDDYGWVIRLELHEFLRDQLTLPSVEALQTQMKRDLEQVRELCSASATA